MKNKKYVPITFLPVTNEEFQESYDRIFRTNKDKASGETSLAIIHTEAGGHKKIYGRKGARSWG